MIGYRKWEQDAQGRLVSRGDYQWKGPEIVAECDRHSHKAPDPDCTCGLYIVKNPGDIPHWTSNPDSVVGLVELSGRIHDGLVGMRAEKARIVSLWAAHSHEKLTERYGVPVERDPILFRRKAAEYERLREGEHGQDW